MINFYDMIGKDKKDVCRWVLDVAMGGGCRECKVSLEMGRENCVEVRDGVLDQMNCATSCLLSIYLYVDGRYSVVTTNRLEKGELRRFIDDSIANTRHLAVDEYRYLPSEELYYRGEKVDLMNYDRAYAMVGMNEKVDLAQAMYAEMDGGCDAMISGSAMVDDYEGCSWSISSNGLEMESEGTSFAVSCNVSVRGTGDERPEGGWMDFAPMWGDVPKLGVGVRAAERAMKKIGARKIDEGEYVMIVENVVARKLLSPIVSAMKGGALQQEQSFLLGRKGEKLFSEKMTIVDNPLELGNVGAQLIDTDGVGLREMVVVREGVLEEYYVSQYMSRKLKCDATTSGPSVLKLKNGGKGLNVLINSQKKAIFVTDFNGGNCNGTTGDFSYGIEGFLIENGVITTPFSEMVVTGNMIELWSGLVEVGGDVRRHSSWQMGSLVFEGVRVS